MFVLKLLSRPAPVNIRVTVTVEVPVKIILALALLLTAANPARADIHFEDKDDDYVTVTANRCPAEIATIAPEGLRGAFFTATARLGMDSGPACAALVQHPQRTGPQVMVVFANKSIWFIDFSAFSAHKPSKTT